jgi:2-C-methyl-D-erythritol 4-phosphate cytidylyltransferase
MNTAILVAAGSGERLGSARPKAFVELAGEPLLVHALRALAASGAVHAYVVVVPPEEVDAAAQMASAVVADDPVRVCAGGASRDASVRHGLAACEPETDVVAVHDAARPLVSPDLVQRVIAALEPPWEAVAPALPVVDTLKLVEGERVLRTVERSGLWGVQTPQVFRLTTLALAHRDLRESAVTDDLALVELGGGRVRVIEGERRNFKVTYPEDLAMAAALLGLRESDADGASS